MKKEIEDLVNEVTSIFHQLDMFQKFRKIVTDNEELKKMDQTMLIAINQAFSNSLVISIGRLCDERSGTRSLVRFLRDLAKNTDYRTRKRHLELYGNSKEMIYVGNLTFDNLAGKSQTIYSKDKINKDIEKLTKTDPCVKILNFRNQYIAHNDKKRKTPQVTYRDLFDSFKIIEQVLEKYNLLIRAVSMPEATPIVQGDWDRVFTVPWIEIRSGYQAR